MSKRFRFGGKRFSLTRMHSSEGTKFFKTLSPKSQIVWAGYDAKRSRNQMKRKMRKGLF